MNIPAEVDEKTAGAKLLRWWWLLGCLLIAGGLWGVTPSLARIATSQGASPVGLTWWQGVGGGLLLLLIAVIRGKTPPLGRNYLFFYLVCGITGTAVPTLILFSAAPHVAVGVISLITALVPIMTYAFSIGLGIDSLTPARVTGVALGFVAVVLVVAPQGFTGQGVGPLWVVVALFIPLGFSIENVFVAFRRPPDSDAIALVSGMLFAGALILTPAMLFGDNVVSMGLPWRAAQWATLGMILVNVVSYCVFLHLIKISGPVFASQAGYFSMTFGVLWGMALFAERHSAWVWAALALMFFGLGLVKERRFRPASRTGRR